MPDIATPSFLAVEAAACLLADAVDRKPGETLAQQVMQAAMRVEDGLPAVKLPKPRQPRPSQAAALQWLTGDNLYL